MITRREKIIVIKAVLVFCILLFLINSVDIAYLRYKEGAVFVNHIVAISDIEKSLEKSGQVPEKLEYSEINSLDVYIKYNPKAWEKDGKILLKSDVNSWFHRSTAITLGDKTRAAVKSWAPSGELNGEYFFTQTSDIFLPFYLLLILLIILFIIPAKKNENKSPKPFQSE